MLKNLMKYELQATARIFLPLYALLLLFALVNKAFLSVNSTRLEIPTAISMTAFVSIIVAIVVITLVMTIQRFYKNLLTDEGYLMFTLPVSTHSHIISKLLVASLWNVLSVVISGFAIFIIAATPDSMREFSKAMAEFSGLFDMLGASAYVITIEGVVLMFVVLLESILTIYAAITLGHLLPKHRVGGALGAYFLIGVAEQIVTSILFNIGDRMGLFDRFSSIFRDNNITTAITAVQLILLALIVFLLVFSAIFYVVTNQILQKKLNLE